MIEETETRQKNPHNYLATINNRLRACIGEMIEEPPREHRSDAETSSAQMEMLDLAFRQLLAEGARSNAVPPYMAAFRAQQQFHRMMITINNGRCGPGRIR